MGNTIGQAYNMATYKAMAVTTCAHNIFMNTLDVSHDAKGNKVHVK
jgi:hypothetical protein